jgi:hypothetical protein
MRSMRTLLSQFCEEFDASVRPLLEPLGDAAEALAKALPDEGVSFRGRQVLPLLIDIADQFTVLADKVKEQQAYVLIFGPLKSGKSTLMNAMSAAYVSEVTSLPAYPCMVYVSDSDQREFRVTRYNGDSEVFHDPAALRMQVNRAHIELADRTRSIEAKGGEFDPAFHFDEAIRRIDVKVPAGELAQSGSVLVDTPGLYSRMKFGYDRMTREFRNAAACAIFVVKTDNLFLEQVFDEFNELLDLFSRIFLVVNLDSSKQDLLPDGSLTPSLESEDPMRVVEAFENLAMSQPLKAAADEGRLRIYPVDLCKAASRRLSEGRGQADDLETRPPGFSNSGQADFDEFMGDLSDYLNSTDYLVAFLGDSLRRALGLLTDSDEACGHPAIAELAAEVARLTELRATTAEHLDELARLEAYDWNEPLAELKSQLVAVGERVSSELSRLSALEVAEAFDAWFQNDASLASLIEKELAPRLEAKQRQLALSVHERLTRDVAEGATGVRLPQEIARDLVSVGLAFGKFGRGALDHVDPTAGIAINENPLPMDLIPVKKSILDWIFLRSRARVRRRLFGPSEAPDLKIPREVKAKRLGDSARRTMGGLLADFQESQVPALLDGLTLRIFEDYAGAITAALAASLAGRRGELSQEAGRIDRLLAEYREVLGKLSVLGDEAAATRERIEGLSQRYRETDPTLLMQPLAPQAPSVLPGRNLGEDPLQNGASGAPAAPEVEAAGPGPASEIPDASKLGS